MTPEDARRWADKLVQGWIDGPGGLSAYVGAPTHAAGGRYVRLAAAPDLAGKIARMIVERGSLSETRAERDVAVADLAAAQAELDEAHGEIGSLIADVWILQDVLRQHGIDLEAELESRRLASAAGGGS